MTPPAPRIRRAFRLGALGCATLVACAPRREAPVRDGSTRGAERPFHANGDVDYADRIASPEAAPAPPELAFCGEFDGALNRAAASVLAYTTKTGSPPDSPELAAMLRAAGAPHVWPHAWTLSAPNLAEEDVPSRLGAFLAGFHEGGVRRCGSARLRAPDGAESMAVVVVDAHGDLEPVPTRARTGQWLRIDATLFGPTTAAKLVVLGPSGAPRTVPTARNGDHATATFALDRPGAFVVQLLASGEEGPRPVLEATIFADVPPGPLASRPAPGESVATAGGEAEAIARMINAARASESVRALVRRPELDRVAKTHAELLRGLGRLAHDAGDGTPLERLRRAGLEPNRSGENVAHATSAALAHRLLWASPSHRENLLDAGFDSMGVGVVPGSDGTLWVCEVFGHFGDTGIH